MEAVQTAMLTLEEFATLVKRPYATVRDWILAGRVQAVTREAGKKTFYRITPEEASSVKSKIERGEWF